MACGTIFADKETRRRVDPQPTRLLLVRHAETQWNREGRYQGQQDSLVTPEGLAQAEAIAGRLRALRVDALYTSDLGRCITTARYIERSTGVAMKVDARLRERHHGIFEGLTKAEVKQSYPDVYRQYKAPDGANYILPGGESRLQVLERACAVMQDVADRHPHEQVVVVGHTGFLYIYLSHLLGVPPDVRNTFVIRNCSLSVLSVAGVRWRLETLGDVCHLGIFA